MGTTANYSWPYPESSDYVADGATAIENLADAVDTTVGGFGDYSNFTPLVGQGFNMTWNVLTQPKYAQVNEFVHYTGAVTITGGTAATGYPVFVQLPVSSAGLQSSFGVGMWLDYSTPDQYVLMSEVVNASYIHFRNDGAALYFGQTGSGSAMLLAPNDVLSWDITYRTA
jgi:hypothetical protein